MEKPDPINPALRQRLEDRKRLHAPWLYDHQPPRQQGRGDESGKQVLFWFAYFLIFGGLAVYFGWDL